MKNDKNHFYLDISNFVGLAILYNVNVAVLLSQDASELFQDQEAYIEAIKKQIRDYDAIIASLKCNYYSEIGGGDNDCLFDPS